MGPCNNLHHVITQLKIKNFILSPKVTGFIFQKRKQAVAEVYMFLKSHLLRLKYMFYSFIFICCFSKVLISGVALGFAPNMHISGIYIQRSLVSCTPLLTHEETEDLFLCPCQESLCFLSACT